MFAAIVGQSWADDAHPFNLEINGLDRISAVPMESVRVEMPGPGSNGSMSFTLFDPTAAITVREWDEVRFIEHAATRPILFGGLVQAVRYSAWATTGRTIDVECVGYGILLDRRVIVDGMTLDWLADFPAQHSIHIADDMVSVVNRGGGPVSALAPATTAYATDNTRGVAHDADWTWWYDGVTEPFTIEGPATLRAMVERFGGFGHNLADPATPVPFVYWVDSAATFRCMPDYLPLGPAWNPSVWTTDGEYPSGIYFDTSGAYRVTGLEYEREGTDRVTRVYVEGGDPAGSGWYAGQPIPGSDYFNAPPRVGDLETIVSEPLSLVATDVAAVGGPIATRSAASTVAGRITIESSATLPFWSGREMRMDFAALGLVSSDEAADYNWRMTRVSISFQTATDRTYQIDWGSNASAGALSARTGRYATR